MEVVGPNCKPPPGGSAVTIGAYDGVHLGHRFVLGELKRLAKQRSLASVVVTFDRHPATVVRPESAPLLLTDLEQKLELLASTGVDRTVVVPFDRSRADESAEDFVNEVLVEALGARLVVVGRDFHFGHDRAGNVAYLKEVGSQLGFDVVGLELSGDVSSSRPISSTRVRGLLAAGDVEGAFALLGRYHEVRGVVVRGDGRGGAELGIPTANVKTPEGLALPAEGIYACWYRRLSHDAGDWHPAAASLGRRPTFYPDGHRLLEVHLLDTSANLYGERAGVAFVKRLRKEQRFDSAQALVEQMQKDIECAREVLSSTAPGVPC